MIRNGSNHIGDWLQTYFKHDVVAVVDGADQIKSIHSRATPDPAAADVRLEIATSLNLLRGRLAALPAGTLDVLATQNPRQPGPTTALIQHFLGRPAIVAAVAVGSGDQIAFRQRPGADRIRHQIH